MLWFRQTWKTLGERESQYAKDEDGDEEKGKDEDQQIELEGDVIISFGWDG